MSRRVAKPIDVLRVTLCGQRRRVSLPDATTERSACARCQRGKLRQFTTFLAQAESSCCLCLSLSLPSLSIFLSLTANDKWLPELTSRRVASLLTCVRKSSGRCNKLDVVVVAAVVRVFYGRVMQCATVRLKDLLVRITCAH